MTQPLLQVVGLSARYGRVPALFDIDLEVRAGEMVALLGANGAGKSTLLRAISRVVTTSGRLALDGWDATRASTSAVAGWGVGHVPEGRGTFTNLTVAENLRLGLLARRREHRETRSPDQERIYALFPQLDQARDKPAGSLSGGQQQMLAVGRALLGRPRLLLVDEPSLGLAPLVTVEIFQTLRLLQSEWDLTILLAEQNARLSLEIADRAYVLDSGQVVAQGVADELAGDSRIQEAYLGV